MKRLPTALLIVVLTAVAVKLAYPHMMDLAIKRQAVSAARGLQTSLLDDGKLHVIVVGSGSPAPDPLRVQACVAIIADGDFLLFDAGGGSAYRLGLLGLPASQISTVFFTHLHSDHMADLPLIANLGWRHGRQHHLTVFGPTGTETVVNGFNQAHHPDLAFRYENTKDFCAPVEVALPKGHDVPTPAGETRDLVYQGPSGLRVYAFLVDHPPVEPAFGYRIEYQDRVVVISGDTRRCENVAHQAQKADILIHEAYNKQLVDRMLDLAADEIVRTPHGAILADEARQVQSYHTSPVEAAAIAAQAQVHTLVFTHIIPPLGNRLARFLVTERLFMAGVKDRFPGQVILAEDGTHLMLELQK
jgi:ribonuclease Z